MQYSVGATVLYLTGFSLRQLNSKNVLDRGFPGGPAVEHPLANAGSVDSLPARGGPHVPHVRAAKPACCGC